MREVIAKLRKNALEEIQIALDDYTGTERIDLRVFAKTGQGPELVPTKKGALVTGEELPWLIDAIDQAARTSPGKDGNHALTRSGGQLRVTRSEYKGTQLVDVRYYFKDAEGQVRPTKRACRSGSTWWTRSCARFEWPRIFRDGGETVEDRIDLEIADPVSLLREIANRYQGTSRCGRSVPLLSRTVIAWREWTTDTIPFTTATTMACMVACLIVAGVRTQSRFRLR